MKVESYPPEKEGMKPYQMRYRWVMLALVSLSYCTFGMVSRSIAPLITPILEDLNISYSQMGIILGSWPVTYIAVAAIGGAIIDRWGIRKSIFVGIMLIGLSEILRYFANGFGTMLIFVALFGLGGPMISIGSPKTISLWFTGKGRGAAMGVFVAASWIGSLTALSTANSIVMPLTGHSWRLTFFYYSLPAFAAGFLWWFLARDVTSAEHMERMSMIKVFTGLVGVKNVQLVIIMGFLWFASFHGFSNWLPKILETGGLPAALAGFAASVPLLVGIPSVLAIPHLVPPRLRGRIAALSSLGMGIALLIIATKASGSALIAGLLLYGASFSPVYPLLMLILMELPEVGSRYIGSAGGMFFCVAEIGGFAGPFLIGAIKDLTGSFMVGMYFVAALSFVVFAMGLSLKTEAITRS